MPLKRIDKLEVFSFNYLLRGRYSRTWRCYRHKFVKFLKTNRVFYEEKLEYWNSWNRVNKPYISPFGCTLWMLQSL